MDIAREIGRRAAILPVFNQVDGGFGHPVQAFVLTVLPGIGAQPGTIGRGQEIEQGLVQGRLVEGGFQNPAGLGRAHMVGVAAVCRGDDGQARRQGFQQHRARILLSGRVNQQIGGAQKIRHVVAAAEKDDPVPDLKPRQQRRIGTGFAPPGDGQARVPALGRRQRTQCPQGTVHPFGVKPGPDQ
ncbi:MAG: hypothetical protein MAG794_00097 [Gammaproteobacteria bacterium]|nr:hypothetical protein [Gammaproteobacteria bacterium]